MLKNFNLSIRGGVSVAPKECSSSFCHASFFKNIPYFLRENLFVANALDLSLNIHEENQAILADGFFIGRSSPFLVSRIVQDTESIIYLKWNSIGTEISNVQIFVKEMVQYFSEQL